MKLIQTVIAGTTVEMRFADAERSDEEWLAFRVQVEGVDESQYLAIWRRAALERAQAAISSEIQRLQALEGRNP